MQRPGLLTVLQIGGILWICFFVAILSPQMNAEKHGENQGHCLPGDNCFPSNSEIAQFIKTLNGTTLSPTDETYKDLAVMKNLRVTKWPFLIVLVETIEDIQKSLKFARKHNLKVTVQSSGHDYQGRSTAHGSLQIFLGNITNTDIKLKTDRSPHGEITLGTGIQWIRAYEMASSFGRIIVGCSSKSVAIGGYTLGGGHSPMSRSMGLGIDSLLEIHLITVDGALVVANNVSTKTYHLDGTVSVSPKSEIFWAVRGGGGGTFGIALSFTFKMYQPPNSFVRLNCRIPYNENDTERLRGIIRKFSDLIPEMPSEWGGYMFLHGSMANENGTIGSLAFSLLHTGAFDSETRAYMDSLVNLLDLKQYCYYVNYTTFYEYAKTIYDPLYYRNAFVSTLMQEKSFTDEWIDLLINFAMQPHLNKRLLTAYVTGTLLGGKVMDVGISETAVHPGFRNALMSVIMTFVWHGDATEDDDIVRWTQSFGDRLTKFGNGIYTNEAGGNVSSWQNNLWGSNYERLLEIKKEWDPDNFLTCLQCVGSELKQSGEDTNGVLITLSGSPTLRFVIVILVILSIM